MTDEVVVRGIRHDIVPVDQRPVVACPRALIEDAHLRPPVGLHHLNHRPVLADSRYGRSCARLVTVIHIMRAYRSYGSFGRGLTLPSAASSSPPCVRNA